MKIAIIDHLPIGTGIIRVATKLAKSLIEIEQKVEIVYFTHYSNFNKNKELFDIKSSKFNLNILKSTSPENKVYSYSKKILQKIGLHFHDKLKEELEAITGFDVIYFTSAHMSSYFNIAGLKFATFHDFNWKYSFGASNFSKQSVQLFNTAMPVWFESTVPLVSNHFIKKEIEKFYSNHKYPIEVIYLPNIGNEISNSVKQVFDFPYILYPANLCSHKNHLNLFHALFNLKNQNKLKGLKLILTGAGTDHFKYAKLSLNGIEESTYIDYDVLGLGYVHNDYMDSLIKHAKLNISASIYEAGSGPAVDAWINKVPFIMSDIEPHKNQLDFFNLECVLFNPFNPYDIAEKIDYSINNLEELKKMSEKAYEALIRYHWNIVAKKYLNIFKKYVNGN